mgnify:CR=1 FL=1
MRYDAGWTRRTGRADHGMRGGGGTTFSKYVTSPRGIHGVGALTEYKVPVCVD